MNNHNLRTQRNFRDISSEIGWADFRAGRPYPTAYDGWDRLTQRNYENGRLRAANYRLARGDRLPPRQPKSFLAITAVVGPAIPLPRSR